MVRTQALQLRKLSATVGAEVLNADVERFRDDDGLADAVQQALDEHGVLLFRNLDIDDDTQIKFSRKLGEVRTFSDRPTPEIFDVGWNPGNPYGEYLRGNVSWHLDGVLDQDIPTRIGILSAKVISPEGGETDFASSYHAYEMLSEEEKDRFKDLRVLFSYEASQRRVFENPTEDMIKEWRKRPTKEHPLVWTHESGRRSLVLSSTMDHIVGMDIEESRALLEELVTRATGPNQVYRHTWAVGDTVIWDNTAVYHRVSPYDPMSGRSLHRTTIVGGEPIH